MQWILIKIIKRMIDLKIPPPVVACVMAGLMYLCQDFFASFFILVLEDKLIIALVIAALAALIDFLALCSFLKAKTTFNPIQANKVSALVTSGVYRFSRNPMYVGNLLFLSAWWVYLGTPLNVIFLVAYVFYINKFQIAPEERILTERFSGQYLDFCQRVRRWI